MHVHRCVRIKGRQGVIEPPLLHAHKLTCSLATTVVCNHHAPTMEAISPVDLKESCLPQTVLKTKVNRHIWPQNSFISDLKAPKALQGKLEGARVMRAPTCMLYAYMYTYAFSPDTHRNVFWCLLYVRNIAIAQNKIQAHSIFSFAAHFDRIILSVSTYIV